MIENVEGSLLMKEVNRENKKIGKGNNGLVVYGRKSLQRGSKGKAQSRSKSCDSKAKNIECYLFGKKGHMKKNCNTWKAKKYK